MMQPPLLIKKIAQKDNHTFSIEWSDGCLQDYRLSELQKKCPCAKCNVAAEETQVVNKQCVDADVRAVRIASVGRYALRISYTSGCSNGIYSYAMLHEIGKGVVHA